MKKGPEGYAFWMNVIMNIILGLLITLAINIAISLQVGMNVITAESVVTTWFSSFVIGVTAGTIADPMSWALKLAGAIKAKKFATWIIQSIILGLYFGTIILLGNMLISYLATGGVMAWLAGFAQWVLFVWVTAIVSVFIFVKLAGVLSASLSGFDPAAQVPPAAE